MKCLYKFYWDCGRMGKLTGVFVADESDIASVIGQEIYFGEVLGKHSEIVGIIEEKDITLLTKDQDFIAKFEQIVGSSGINPLSYHETD